MMRAVSLFSGIGGLDAAVEATLGARVVLNLRTVVSWPTPTSAAALGGNLCRGGKRSGELLLSGAVKVPWPTPRAAFDAGTGSKGDVGLHGAVKNPWPTPRSQDAKHGAATAYELTRDPLLDLLHVSIVRQPEAPTVEQLPWASPAARDFRSGLGREPDNGHTPQLPEQVGGTLHPEFVEALMGLPLGWTASTGERMHVLPAPLWPAGRGAPQHPWESPRVAPARSIPDRTARLRALGNAVVPQQAALAIALLVAQHRAGGTPRQVDLFG